MHKPFSLTSTLLILWRRLRLLHPHLHSPPRPLAPSRRDLRLARRRPAPHQPRLLLLLPPFRVRTLTTDEKDRFVISPEQLANVDRQLMEKILSTITLPATRPAYIARSVRTVAARSSVS
eukprot:3711652-Pleurochrysis_carterae.AAC.2